MEEVITVGREFGTVVMVQENATQMTFEGIEAALKTLKDDYETQQKNSFPFYTKKPQIIITTHGKAVLGDEDMAPSELHTVIGWYLVVPAEQVIAQS